MDVDPKTRGPAPTAITTRNQKKRLPLGNSEIQLSGNETAAEHGVEGDDIDPRHTRNIADVEETARGVRINRDLSPPRDRHGRRSSSGGRKDPSPQEIGYHNDIAQRNALLADKDLEIQRLSYLLDRERSERRRTESAIERDKGRLGGHELTRPRPGRTDKERQGKGGQKNLPTNPERSRSAHISVHTSTAKSQESHRHHNDETYVSRQDVRSPEKFDPAHTHSMGHSRANNKSRYVRRERGSLKVQVGEKKVARGRRSPSAEASSGHPSNVAGKRERPSDPPEDDLREYLRLKRKFEQEGKDVMKARLGLSRSSPFPAHIANMDVPKRFHQPNFKEYDGVSDPLTHVKDYLHKMTLWSNNEALMCVIFSSSLGALAQNWYFALRPGSIAGWDQLREAFVAQFHAYRKFPKTDESIMAITMKTNETLIDFNKRFWGTYTEVQYCSEDLAIKAYKQGLHPDSDLRRELVRRPVYNLSELQARIDEFIQVEEDLRAAWEGRFAHAAPKKPVQNRLSSPEHKKDKQRSAAPIAQKKSEGLGVGLKTPPQRFFEAVHTIFKEPIYKMLDKIKDKAFFEWPAPMRGDPSTRNQNLRCAFHKQVGHRTDSCQAFKASLERWAKAGHLNDFIDPEKSKVEGVPARQDPDLEGPITVISVIHAAPSAARANRLRGEAQKAAHMQQVMQAELGSATKRLRSDKCPMIGFSDEDKSGVKYPHCDPLVITVRLRTFDIMKVLVDTGSAVEVMYHSCFRRMGLKDSDLEPMHTPLIGFSAKPVYPLGKLRVPVRAGSVTVETEFIVVDSPSPYNAIVGRTWLHDIKGIASTYHQKLKFPGPNGIEVVSGDQITAKHCVLAVAPDRKEINKIEVKEPKEEELEKVGREPAEKSIEGLKKVQIDESDQERYILLGQELSEDEHEELLKFLIDNKEVFAWTPKEMPGIDPGVMVHRLNVDPTHKPVVQKARRSSPAHADAVVEEVERLIEAEAIREVQYPTWLANTVVVKKKNGKWRVCVDFTDLNKACPKDSFPLPKIDQLIDATAGHERMSFLDAYRGYHQIAMFGPDQCKTSFITPRGLFCYKVMPFGLRNAGATYQRLVTRMFRNQIGKNVEVYIDDMVIKSKQKKSHIEDLKETFEVLKEYKLKLNASKCAFGVGSGKFLGSLVTRRGIEASPEQIKAIKELRAPSSAKDVQKLTGMAAALNRFISKSSDKCRPFFQLLRKNSRFEWDKECGKALEELKEYMSSAPLLTTPEEGQPLFLYLAVSDHAVSSVLVKERDGEQQPVYYVSKTLLDAQTRYSPLEKLAWALVMTSRKLVQYFQAHTIVVITEHPLKAVLRKADLSGRIAQWAVELGQFDIKYRPRTAIKGQILADFISEFSPQPIHHEKNGVLPSTSKETDGNYWKLYVDGSSNNKGSGAGIVLHSPDDLVLELALRINFKASNNESEYEALIEGLRGARNLGATKLLVFCDSQLVTNQLSGEYQAKDVRMAAYVQVVKELMQHFEDVQITQVGRSYNSHADALANLASAIDSGMSRKVEFGYIDQPSIDREAIQLVACAELGPSWMDPIISYLTDDVLPDDKKEAHKLRLKSARFYLSSSGKLYRKSFMGPLLQCVHPSKVEDFLYEIHEGICGMHIGGRSLAHRAISQGYWWPYMQKDAEIYVRKCEKCQRFAPNIHLPSQDLNPLTSPWPFAQWGLDIVGPMPKAAGNVRYMITATDYFTKWIEAKPLANIGDREVESFTWKYIITRFGIPRALVSDNGTQFDSSRFKAFCAGYDIRNYYSTPAYPQSNGQAEISNKTILDGIKKRLEKAKSKWIDELPSVLWAYRTTPRRATGETPYAMAYGMEAVIPLEIGLPTFRTEAFEQGTNDVNVATYLDWAEEKREAALVKLAAYQGQLSRSYNQNVKQRSFGVGELVLKKMLPNMKDPTDGKLGAKWAGPFKIISKAGLAAYRLEDMEGRMLPRPWNASHLKKFYY